MDYPAFVTAVAEMRRLQKLYDSTEHTNTVLVKRGLQEQQVDTLLAEYTQRQQVENAQMEMFAEKGREIDKT